MKPLDSNRSRIDEIHVAIFALTCDFPPMLTIAMTMKNVGDADVVLSPARLDRSSAALMTLCLAPEKLGA